MENHVSGHPVLGELRHALAALIVGNPLLLLHEQLLANHRIHECEDAQLLTRWLTNTTVALACRHPAGFLSAVSLAGHVV